MYPQQQMPPGAIGVELDFGFLCATSATSTNFLQHKCNLFVEIDGVANEREGGVWHVFPVGPGWHLVRVFFRVRPSFLSRDTGSMQLQVMVPPNGMARLKSRPGRCWPMSSAKTHPGGLSLAHRLLDCVL